MTAWFLFKLRVLLALTHGATHIYHNRSFVWAAGVANGRKRGKKGIAREMTATATSTATGAICFHFVLTSAGRARWNKRLCLKPELKPELQLETGVVLQAKFWWRTAESRQRKCKWRCIDISGSQSFSGTASGAELSGPTLRQLAVARSLFCSW